MNVKPRSRYAKSLQSRGKFLSPKHKYDLFSFIKRFSPLKAFNFHVKKLKHVSHCKEP